MPSTRRALVVVPTDLGSESDCRNLIERTAVEYGRIDTLINNAGISMWSRFDELRDRNVSVLDAVRDYLPPGG